ncbi:MAG: hypothetical protein Q8844_03055, partial [Pigeon pea little leaf phytoplasma]|nr:hypothetical protein [Pigeon pea little leaf phytoplasma]
FKNKKKRELITNIKILDKNKTNILLFQYLILIILFFKCCLINPLLAHFYDENKQKIMDLKNKIFQYRIILDADLNQTQKLNKELDILSSEDKKKLDTFLNDIEVQKKTYITELNNFQTNNSKDNEEVILLKILEKQEKSYIELGRKRCS